MVGELQTRNIKTERTKMTLTGTAYDLFLRSGRELSKLPVITSKKLGVNFLNLPVKIFESLLVKR